MPAAYAELHCRSNFSFLLGASHPEELVQRAAQLGYSALALTDEATLAGVVRAHLEAKRVGLHLIVGAEMRLHLPGQAVEDAPGGAHLVLLAQSRRGYGHLSHWITLARRRAPKGRYQALAADVEGRTPAAPHLAGLPGCAALLVPQVQRGFEAAFAQAMWLKTWFGPERAFIALERLHRWDDEERADLVQRLYLATGLPVVAAGAVLMHVRSRKPLQDVLTATRLNRPLAECGLALEPNAEAHLRSLARLQALYPQPLLDATVALAGQCAFSLDELRYEYPQEIVPQGHTPGTWLRALTEAGAAQRFPQGVPDPVRRQLNHELQLIAQLQYEPYFLTVADIVHWAREQGILCQGRGSAANSAVCYCLHITEVDPARTSVLFERFISAERQEPPDIDVDFEHQRREEVIQYLYRKYGRHRAALAAVVISYRRRSAVRDVGRALGLDLDRIEAVCKDLPGAYGSTASVPAEAAASAQAGQRRLDPARFRDQGFDPQAPITRLWLDLSEQLLGFPRHLSQHPGGFVIAREDLAQLVPVENASMEGRSVIQWDKDDLDALGLIKVDILALGMLSAIRRALAEVAFKRGTRFVMQDIPAEDPAVYAMLSQGDSVGVFQVESRAQMSMLPRLQPQCFYDLVIEVAIVRPGPIQGGMVHPYLRRRTGEEAVSYPSEEVRRALDRTLGVPIFQEQVMQLAMLAADFTAGEADQLRRAMAAWKRRGGLGPFHERLVGRMVAKGYEREYAEAIFRQIEGFGEYGFPESHAASFALLVYASAWIKCHHPDAFLAALLNSQPMGFYAPAQLVRDARAHGVTVRPVDIHHSAWDSTLECPADGQGLWPVRLGLGRISGLGEAAARRIVAARQAGGTFDSVEDLVRRAQLSSAEVQRLAHAGALASLAGHRHQALWTAAGVDTRPPRLLQDTRSAETAVALNAPTLAEDTVGDYLSTGLSLRAHPVGLLRPQLALFHVQPAQVLAAYPSGRLARASGLVTHRQRPETANGVVFVTLEDDTGSINVIVWPAVAQRHRQALLRSRLLTVFGTWQAEGSVRHLIAQRLVDHTELLHGLGHPGQAPVLPGSRDFR